MLSARGKVVYAGAMMMVGWAATATSAGEIAVVDVARIFEQYKLTQDLESSFEQQQRELTSQAEKKRESLDQMRRSLAAFDPTSQDYTKRENEMLKAEVEYQVWSTVEQKRLKSEHQNWLRRIYHDTQRVIGDIARSRGYDLVLTYDRLLEDASDSTSLRQQILLQKVIYYNDQMDITEEVLTRLNSEYASQNQGGSRPMSSQSPLDESDHLMESESSAP